LEAFYPELSGDGTEYCAPMTAWATPIEGYRVRLIELWSKRIIPPIFCKNVNFSLALFPIVQLYCSSGILNFRMATTDEKYQSQGYILTQYFTTITAGNCS